VPAEFGEGAFTTAESVVLVVVACPKASAAQNSSAAANLMVRLMFFMAFLRYSIPAVS
jgi:hypothetical protein